MNFTEAIRSGFCRYATATGRAPRSEYWYWTLFTGLASVAGMAGDYVLLPENPFEPIATIVGLILLLPNWAVGIRRLHGINRSGYWLLVIFTGIGFLLVLYWVCIKGTEGENDYGSDPLLTQPTAS
jgi:uncharacterized membrane protein YhaH (DUF805 family)